MENEINGGLNNSNGNDIDNSMIPGMDQTGDPALTGVTVTDNLPPDNFDHEPIALDGDEGHRMIAIARSDRVAHSPNRNIRDMSCLENLAISREIVPIKDLRIKYLADNVNHLKTNKAKNEKTRLVMPDGRELRVTDKFFHSFNKTTNQSKSIFDLFAPDEVFKRMQEKDPSMMVRITVENYKKATEESAFHGLALTMTPPSKAVLGVDSVLQLAAKHGGMNATYKDGTASLSFNCPFQTNLNITGSSDSDFTTRFNMQFPLDGFGLPASYLELLRKVCSNGAVAMTKAFRTEFSLGKGDSDLLYVLDRAMSTFNNEEGFHSFAERMRSATNSWASLHNYVSLNKAITRACQLENKDIKARRLLIGGLDKLCNNPLYMYNIIAGNEPSTRYSKILPVECTVYDLINYGTEVATHHFNTLWARNSINGWLGDLIVSEFDLENSKTTKPDFTDYYLDTSRARIKETKSQLGN